MPANPFKKFKVFAATASPLEYDFYLGKSMSKSRSKQKNRTRWLMVTLMIAIFLSPLNVNFTTVAMPTMRDFFSVNVEQVTWIGIAYFLPSVIFMPFQASLGEHFGVRKVFVTGLLLLAIGSLLASLAPTFQWLLASRFLQGIGWSALYPLALILIRMYFPNSRQGEMMGIWESAVGMATIISPVIGGLIVDFLSWKWLYVTLGVVAGLGLYSAATTIPPEDVKLPFSGNDFDWSGALTFTLASGLTLLAIVGRSPLLFLLGLLAGILWLWRARRIKRPFINPEIFINKEFMGASLAANLRMLIAIAALTALPLFFEDVQLLRPSRVGFLMVIYSLFLFLSAWPGGLWTDRSGARAPGAAGFLAMVVGLILLLGFDDQLEIFLVALALAVRGVGAGLSQTPFAQAATEAVSINQKRLSAGLYGTIRYSGLAFGTVLVGIFLQQRLTYYGALSGGPDALPAYRELWIVLIILGMVGLGLTRFLLPGGKPQLVYRTHIH